MPIAKQSCNDPKTEFELSPLCVDLDGTLVHTDILHENLIFVVTKKPWLLFMLFLWMARGRAYLKTQLAKYAEFDPSLLPYDDRVVSYLQREKKKGRRLILATASIRSQADAVANHLGLFDLVLATGPGCNLKGKTKASVLRKCLQRFSYLGNDRSDIAVWTSAETASIANATGRTARRLSRSKKIEVEIPRRPATLCLLKALRPYQWVKNLLIFVPIVTANQIFEPAGWVAAACAFAAFSLTASGIYVLNDLTDLAADRRHPRKRNRPFASGRAPVLLGIMLAPCLVAVGLAVAWYTGVFFTLLLYVVVSFFYTTYGKELPLVDVFSLAFLYVIRLFAGGVATGFHVSQWLLGFSAFLFLSLALIKRVAEISTAAQDAARLASRRGYFGDDHIVLTMMGITSSFASCVLLALFVQSADVGARYASPGLLWALVPLILFWQMRLWLSTTRGYMNDDPIVYAARDWVSWVASANGAAIMLVASHFELWT
jgi:4-hydroxybenzoate polyprenyltransferase